MAIILAFDLKVKLLFKMNSMSILLQLELGLEFLVKHLKSSAVKDKEASSKKKVSLLLSSLQVILEISL